MQVIARLPHVGLSPEPTARSRTEQPIYIKVVSLPYMGPHKHDDAIKRPYPTVELRLKSYEERETGLSDAEKPPEFTDPCELLIQKVSALSRMLGCTEADAEALLFKRL